MKNIILCVIMAILITISCVVIAPTFLNDYDDTEAPINKDEYRSIASFNNDVEYYDVINDITFDSFKYDTDSSYLVYYIHYKYYLYPLYYDIKRGMFKYDNILWVNDLATAKEVLKLTFKYK